MCCLLKRPRNNNKRPLPSPPATAAARHSQTFSSSSSALPSTSSSAPFSANSSTSTSSSLPALKGLLPSGPSLYRFHHICLATHNFSPSHKIGRSVWKGVLRDTPVAISKKQGSVSVQHLRDALGKVHSLRHASLVRLLGGCKEGEHLYLVYEFVEGGNLRDCLRSKQAVGYSPLSSWSSRMQIALDVAKGLEYLHHLTSQTFVHKFLDSRNVLVTNDFRAKVAHVGIAQLCEEMHQQFPESAQIQESGEGEIEAESSAGRRIRRSRSVKITGIQGYMPPEYLISGEVTPKYDVFAFGVVLSELLSGKEALVWKPSLSLPDMLHSVMKDPDSRSKLRLWMDPFLRDSYPLDDAYNVAGIALACVDPDPQKRPQMCDVAFKLQEYLLSSKRWEAAMGNQKEILSSTLQPR